MTYATITDLIASLPRGEQELIELTDLAHSGAYDPVKVEFVMRTATTTIDAHIGTRYPLPLPLPLPQNTADLLRDIQCKLARAELYGDKMPEEIGTRRDNALKLLYRIARGEVSLQLPEPSQQAGLVVGGEILVSGPDRVFGRTNMRSW